MAESAVPSIETLVTGGGPAVRVDYGQLKKDDIKQWDKVQVAAMISSFMNGNECYASAFIENDIDGVSVFQINRGFLAAQLGVKDRAHQTQILTGLRRLKINQTKWAKGQRT